MLSDAAGLDLNDNFLDETSALGDDVIDHAISDDGLTFLMIMRNIPMMRLLYKLVFLTETFYQ